MEFITYAICKTCDNYKITDREWGKHAYKDTTFLYFMCSGTILTVNRLCRVAYLDMDLFCTGVCICEDIN